VEVPLTSSTGEQQFFNGSYIPKFDAKGQVDGLIGYFRNITELKQAEEALQESEAKYHAAFELCTDAIFWADVHTEIIINCNRAAENMIGVSRDKLIGQHRAMLHPPELKEFYAGHFRRHTERGSTEEYEAEVISTSGQRIPVLISATRLKLGNREVLQGIFRDITGLRRAEEELRTSRLQLRALATRLQQIREEERLMIAREIHDEMGGGLTGLKMDLSWILRKMGDADPCEERVALMDKIHTSNALIDHMIQVVRRISTELRPSVLDDLGMIAALEWQLSEFTSRTEIPHEFATTFEYVNMEEDTAVAVFRIFQEALTNVVRHSRATKVAVFLREGERSLFGDESLVLEIRDNGRGITEEEILNPESLGLLGMKERVLAFGGELSIFGEPGGGTALVLKIPRIQGEPS
jgi:PAS domain S-box-containing protein